MISPVLSIVIAGVVACLVLDLWQQLLMRVFGIPAANFAVVGRWFLRIWRFKTMYQPTIDSKPPEPNELLVGWWLHYAVSVGYAAVFYTLMNAVPVFKPTLLAGLVFGALSVAVPWFYFMPCMGKGVMARCTATPIKACGVALANHSVYGAAIAMSMGQMV
ncbi:MAG: DUF2938 family protein [Polaromonas sp.]|nr:DUF2938 family protein [Polaromonas sp.]